jgi:drug/metabolite transporter (DMT)-like permease
VGLVIGLAGVALVVGVSAGTRTSEWPGLVAVLGGALANAAGSYGLRWRYAETPALEGAFAVVAGSAVASLPLLLISFPPNLPGTRAAVGLLGLGTLSTGIAVVLYVSLVQRCGNGRATLVNYLLPAFALLYASIFLSEAVTVTDLAGFGLIAIGVLVAAGSAAAAGAVLPIGIDRGVKIRRSR